jgi:hypothetical protein
VFAGLAVVAILVVITTPSVSSAAQPADRTHP